MVSKELIISSITLSGVMASAASEPAKLPQQPNILFFFSDDHAVKSISAYGYKGFNETPNIDAIAKEGAIFENSFCANSICSPSRACVLTGKHSHLNGQLTNSDVFDGSQDTFPKLLHKNGYSTALIGKWHLKSDPTGFDHWVIYPGQGNYYNPVYKVGGLNGKIKNVNPEGYSVELTADFAMDWLSKQKDSKKPFLLMCQFKAPHRTWAPGPKYLHLYEDRTFPMPDTFFDDFKNRVSVAKDNLMSIDKDMRLGYDLKVPAKAGQKVAEVSRMTPEQRKLWDAAFGPRNEAFRKANLTGKALAEWKYQRYIKNYFRCVTAVDDNVGRVMKKLKELGLDKNTIVIYSADQGFYLGEHGWFDKRWMYEESFRTPLLMKWPGVIKPGTHVKKLVQNIDLAPTFLKACGVEVPKEVQGENFIPLLTGQDVKWRDAIYYHYYESPSEHNVPFQYGVRTERYKLINYYGVDEWELFDLKKDPHEVNSVYNNPEYKEIIEKMKKKLTELRTQYKNSYGADNPAPMSDNLKRWNKHLEKMLKAKGLN